MEQILLPSWGVSEPQNSPPPVSFQLRVHVEFLPDLFPAADLGGICVRDLLLREGESSLYLNPGRLLPSLPSPLMGPLPGPGESHPGSRCLMLDHNS